MYTADRLNTGTVSFDMHLGPLRYRFVSGDAWGDGHLRAMARHLQTATAKGTPDRIVRLAREPLPGSHAGWQQNCSPLGTISHLPGTSSAAWTAAASAELPSFSYELPWSLIMTDMAPRNGAVIHAGVAARGTSGLLFLAPSGGGKTTTLASAPSGWTVLSDDAALVWPDKGGWQASPLPSWTMMTTPTSPPAAGRQFDLGRRCSVHGLIVLAKDPVVNLARLAPVEAAPWLFHALNEYPSTVIAALPLKEHFFRVACAMARALPCWRLGLPLGGAIWPQLEALLEEHA